MAGALFGPTPFEQIRPQIQEVLQSARELGNRKLEAQALRGLGAIQTAAGEFDAAEESLRQGMQLLRELGMNLDAAAGQQTGANLAVSRGDHAAAEQILRQSYEELDALHETSMLSTVAVMLALELIELDRDDEADHFADIAEETATLDDVASQVLIKITRGLIRARGGHVDEGETLALEAVELIDTTDHIEWQGKMRLRLGEILARAGRPDEAARTIREAIELLETKGDVAAANQGREALRALMAR